MASRADPSPLHPARLDRIRAVLAGRGLDAILVTHPPNLRYLTGFDGSAGALLIAADRQCLFVDGRYVTAVRDHLARTAGLAGIAVVLVEGSYDAGLARGLAALPGARIGFDASTMTVARLGRLSASLEGDATLVPTEGLVEDARVVKDAAEIAILRRAARMLSEVARGIVPAVRPGLTETDVAARVDDALRRAGFERPAFETIVASGPNSALPHARPGPRVLEPGDGVVLDFGGVHDGYCVDLTRTVCLEPASDALRRIFTAVRAAHAAALAAAAPGVKASVVDAAARDALVGHGLGEAFLHGTGHGLGLEIHERPRLSRAEPTGLDEILRAGMVITIEPGAYVAGLGGVRLEDDVLVVEGGCEVLTDVPLDPLA